MSRWRFDLAFVLFLAASAYGCGDEGNTCGFEPCGGDLEGKWYQETACPADDLAAVGHAISGHVRCASKVTVVDFHSSGTLLLDSYKEYTRTKTLMLTWQLSWNRSCMNALSGRQLDDTQMAAECSSYGDYLVQSSGLNFSSGRCGSPSPDKCICELGQTDFINWKGTYTTFGTTLALDNGVELQVCRKGTVLKTRDDSGPLGPIVETFAPL
jgi:hypothetical protein